VFSDKNLPAGLNQALSTSLGTKAEYVKQFDYPVAWLDQDAFAAIRLPEEDAEHAVGEALKRIGLRGYYTRAQLAKGDVPPSEQGLKYLHSYSPHGSWYVIGIPAPFSLAGERGTSHLSPYTYDTHVPLAFYGLAFQPGTYRTHTEPVDLAPTLASLLGINAPTHAIGRVLTKALSPARGGDTSGAARAIESTPARSPGQEIAPADVLAHEAHP
jgi:hypothetical protein